MHRQVALKVLGEWLQIVFGLMIFAFGVSLTIAANIGVAPWDCLGYGIANQTPLNYGVAMTLTSLLILGIDLLLRERIGFGTVLDALLTGNFTNWFVEHSPIPGSLTLAASIAVMIAGMLIMAFGQFFYMRAGQCCGPRDTLLVGLGKRMSKFPIGLVEIIIFALVLLIGWLLGGPVGIGTVLSTCGCGTAMQLVFRSLRFEPRNVQHRDIITVVRSLIR